jgi:hypothetical protein
MTGATNNITLSAAEQVLAIEEIKKLFAARLRFHSYLAERL